LKNGVSALTEREKQTLRLIVRGHDAKSVARSLGLSVHTINERLRDARRKLSVSSSREAARLLMDAEAGVSATLPPYSAADTEIGDDIAAPLDDPDTAPIDGVGPAVRRPRIIIGVLVMTFVLGLLAIAMLPYPAVAPPRSQTAASEGVDAEVVAAARNWLVLVDASEWDESYRATGLAFRRLNTARIWATVSQKVRVPLGALVSRTFLSQENLPAPPSGYEVVKFRTSFANKADVVETVSLDREGGTWRVVGITVG
jgi:DNA-binding CsgD family transcriptional regulator